MNKAMEIKSYGKSELARLYFCDCDPHVAQTRLWSWIRRCRPLAEALESCNQSKKAKYYSPQAVRLIVQYLGEP